MTRLDEAPPVLIARALRWLRAELVPPLRRAALPIPPEAAGTPRPARTDDALAEELVELMLVHPPPIDPVVARDAVEFVLRRSERDPWTCLDKLACAVVTLEDGMPVHRAHPGAEAVTQLFDPDVLVAWVIAGAFGGLETRALSRAVEWPAILPGARSEVDGLFRYPFAELHCHIAGAIPPSAQWAQVLVGGPPPWAVKPPIDVLGWREALAEAAADLLAIGAQLYRWPKDPDTTGDVHAVLRRVLREVHPAARSSDDPLCDVEVHAERALLVRAFVALAQSPSAAFERALLRYISTKAAFHARLTMGEGARGLARFQETDAHHRVHRGDEVVARDRWRVAEAIRCAVRGFAPDVDLKPRGEHEPREHDRHAATLPPLDLELRASLSASGGEALDQVRGWLLGVRSVLDLWGDVPLRVGFVVSLWRSDGRPDLPREQVERLMGLLEERPELRPWVVGVDAAGDEMSAPPRTFASAFAVLRQRLDAHRVAGAEPRCRLGFTVHAGEDFRDLLTGLRYVDDAVQLLGLRPRDRVGHGLALFWDARRFYARRPVTYPRVQDLIVDLAWCFQLHRGRVELAERARRFFSELLGLNVSQTQLQDAFASGSGGGAGVEDPTEDDVVRRVAPTLYDRRREMVAVSAGPDWIELVEACQRVVLRRVEQAGVAVEINPTSNVRVGGFVGHRELPYLMRARATEPFPIPLVVGSDDPGVFHTTLRREYEHVARALRELGWSGPGIAEFTEHLRRTSRDFTFIQPSAPRGAALADALDPIIGPHGQR